MSREDGRPSWEAIELCRGITKKGKLCCRQAETAFEIEPGNLFVPLTCTLHTDQEESIRKELLENSISLKGGEADGKKGGVGNAEPDEV